MILRTGTEHQVLLRGRTRLGRRMLGSLKPHPRKGICMLAERRTCGSDRSPAVGWWQRHSACFLIAKPYHKQSKGRVGRL